MIEVLDISSSVDSFVALTLNDIISIQALSEPDVYMMLINFTDSEGTREQMFVSRPDDPFGLGPAVRQWMVDHPEFPISPYVPPTIEEIREAMAPMERLTFKTKFKTAGMNLAKINAYLASIEEDESHWEDMYNYYTETTTFTRMSTFVVELAVFSAKTPEQIDTIWTT